MSHSILRVELVNYDWSNQSPAYRVHTSFGLIFDVLLMIPNARLRCPTCEAELVQHVRTLPDGKYEPIGTACAHCGRPAPYPFPLHEVSATEQAVPPYSAGVEAHMDPLSAVLVVEPLEAAVRELQALKQPRSVQEKAQVRFLQRKLLQRRLRRFEGRPL